ncbi:FAD/NAD(P)-binding protein [Galbibacter sp. BG1]|uniref:FAD/NAD(P)-binding protein n=1 Tax=Galbibacter sp. BG1 TaxID=1170699 RepID=UPI0015BBE9B0|nr:FAD/NAD(P)-binding protein [Galbibacter sp. BG1]QLE02500.1 FAD/NAD(P)-binding protein [Galbibacter sp. BG1]
MQTKLDTVDLTFIGSGISSTFTLLYLLEHIEKSSMETPLKICIVNKYAEFFTGIPYGSRSGNSVLLITSLKNFLPEPERSLFIEWLQNNKEWLIDELLDDGGHLSLNWIKKHAKQIENNEWEDLFVPRSFFGRYLTEKIEKLISRLQSANRIDLTFLTEEVLDVEKSKQLFTVFTKNKTLHSKKVVLAVGSLPTKTIYMEQSVYQKNDLLVINDNYTPSLQENLNLIKNFSSNRKKQPNNVLIIGANASALELLYKLNDDVETVVELDHFTFLSTHGILPDAVVDTQKQAQFIPVHLKQLENKDNLTAKEIAAATYKDLDAAGAISLGAASTVGIISSAFGVLLAKLSKEELKIFACKYGNEIGRRQRCAGEHYTQTINKLLEKNRFNHIAGRYHSIEKGAKTNSHYLKYFDTSSGTLKTADIPYHIVINCIGSKTFNDKEIPVLLKNLIDKGLCTPNESHIGLQVNDSLEATENLHIVGPLLAGNIIENKAVWHVEHCGRITWLSSVLATVLFEKFKTEKHLNNVMERS